MLNQEIAGLFQEMAELTKLEDENPQSFRARAYESAARALETLIDSAADLSASQLVAVSGIGKSSAAKIKEFVDTGRIEKLEGLRQMFPAPYLEIVRIPGIGAKSASKMRSELGIETLEQLKAAIAAQSLRDLSGFGAKTEEKIASAIDRLGLAGKDARVPLTAVMPQAERLVGELASLEGVDDAIVCGSVRRLRETTADIDVLVSASKPAPVMEAVQALPAVREIIAAGSTKTSFLNQAGMQVDVRVVEPAAFGAAVMYFTGSKAHNIALRQRALDRGWTLNEYSLSDGETGEVVASATETEIYAALDLDYVPPPMREGTGEIERATTPLADIVTQDMLNGDLHVHTDLSGDGEDSLEAMVETAAELGYSYVGITDHAEDLTINGANREQMLAQREQVQALQKNYPELRILHGAELNIDPDGQVDYDDAFLADYDWTVASVHSAFDLDPQRQTVRLITAMSNPAIRAIGHLTGRKIGKRPGIEFDLGAVLEAAEISRTALEINCSLARLDVSADMARQAYERDVLFVISTDAHRTGEMRNARWGVANAQRGWVRASQVTNTWSQKDFLAWLEGTP